MNKVYPVAAAALVLITSCATPPSTPPTEAVGAYAEIAVIPVNPTVDHHLHLMGPTIASLVDGPPPLPAVDVPPAIAGLLKARADAWNDPSALQRLFTRDSVALSHHRYGWVKGREAVARYLSSFARPYYLTPIDVQEHGPLTVVSGYYSRGEPSAFQHIGYFSLTAKRTAEGEWQITSEVPRFPFPRQQEVITAEQIVKKLDENGVRKALILSEAFWADGPLLEADKPYDLVKAENDWTAREVAKFPDRLIAFCSFNPVADHALAELERCAANDTFKGLKFSFAMSGVDVKKVDHLTRLRSVFAAANKHGLPIVAHVRQGSEFTAEHVDILLSQVISAAPDIPVQIAHLWGGEAYSESALEAWARAVSTGRREAQNLYFDIAEVWADISQTSTVATQQAIARYIRQIGLSRILFGSDGRTEQRRSWQLFKATVPLGEEEFALIAANVAPYAK